MTCLFSPLSFMFYSYMYYIHAVSHFVHTLCMHILQIHCAIITYYLTFGNFSFSVCMEYNYAASHCKEVSLNGDDTVPTQNFVTWSQTATLNIFLSMRSRYFLCLCGLHPFLYLALLQGQQLYLLLLLRKLVLSGVLLPSVQL